MTSAGQLAADLQNLGLDLSQLQARIETAAGVENIRATVAALQDTMTRARNRAVARAVASRWTYARIRKATGLSTSRIGQIAPARAGRDAPST